MLKKQLEEIQMQNADPHNNQLQMQEKNLQEQIQQRCIRSRKYTGRSEHRRTRRCLEMKILYTFKLQLQLKKEKDMRNQ